MTRPFWKALGLVSLVLGGIGILLPVVPTTPFIIVAAFAFAKGEPRLARKLENHVVFGPILTNWRTHGAIAPRYKALAVGMMAVTLGASLVWGAGTTVLLIQAVCIVAAAAFILSRPSGAS